MSHSDVLDEFGLAPRDSNVLFGTPGAGRDAPTSEGFGGGVSDMEAEGYGKPASLFGVVDEMDVTEEEDGRDTLFYVHEPFGGVFCEGVISSGQGIRRCCIQPVLSGTTT